MAGIQKDTLQIRKRRTVHGRDGEGPVIIHGLKKIRNHVDFLMGIEGILCNPFLFLKALHDRNRIVEHTHGNREGRPGHKDSGSGEIFQNHREGTKMVDMAVTDKDGMNLLLSKGLDHGKALMTVLFGMDPGIQ